MRLRARRADFQVGGANANALVWGNYGDRGHAPPQNVKLKSSEMARNGSKTSENKVNF